MPITRETTFAARDLTEPVTVTHTKNSGRDIFLIRLGGRGIDYEVSRDEAAALRRCLGGALSEARQDPDPVDARELLSRDTE